MDELSSTYLCFGSTLKHLLKKSFASLEMKPGISGDSPENAIRRTVQPKAQISAGKPCSSPRAASGGIYIGVPPIAASSANLAQPKLVILTSFNSVNSTLLLEDSTRVVTD
ncbi:hypothetical protein ACP275_04G068700 [Erythranthe tilingii]